MNDIKIIAQIEPLNLTLYELKIDTSTNYFIEDKFKNKKTKNIYFTDLNTALQKLTDFQIEYLKILNNKNIQLESIPYKDKITLQHCIRAYENHGYYIINFVKTEDLKAYYDKTGDDDYENLNADLERSPEEKLERLLITFYHPSCSLVDRNKLFNIMSDDYFDIMSTEQVILLGNIKALMDRNNMTSTEAIEYLYLELLAQPEDWELRKAIAQNPYTSIEVLDKLVNDNIAEVREAALENPNYIEYEEELSL